MGDNSPERVLIVSLGSQTWEWSALSQRDIVEKRRRFFHPVGGKYPSEPVKWIGFRYDGKLQGVHQVERSSEVPNRAGLADHFPEIDREACERTTDSHKSMRHFVYELSEPIRPDHVIPNGPSVIASRRVWADLDLLMSATSITEAEKLTNRRRKGMAVTSDHGTAQESTAKFRTMDLPIPDAQSLIDRIKTLVGLPERNHEDVVRELLIRLGHSPSSIVFQVGRIDVSVKRNDGKDHTIFEVKRSIASESNRASALRQANDYANRTGAEMFVITDGDYYIIYDRRKGRSYAEMLIGSFRLSMFRPEDEPLLDLLRPN